jgi:hypothetical protein
MAVIMFTDCQSGRAMRTGSSGLKSRAIPTKTNAQAGLVSLKAVRLRAMDTTQIRTRSRT